MSVLIIFQSTLPAGGATLPGDTFDINTSNFNPRSPQGERLKRATLDKKLPRFQSTLPAGERLSVLSCLAPAQRHFNPRSPQGERLMTSIAYKFAKKISIHAPRRGSDYADVYAAPDTLTFQSTLPAGGATALRSSMSTSLKFQSTLPAGGATWVLSFHVLAMFYFNPRSPQGERLKW